jgi:zinc protease
MTSFLAILMIATAPPVSVPADTELPPQAAPALPELPATNATLHTLPNGLTVVINVDRSAPVASLQAWCATGSIHEGEWMGAGLSHILEHMLFKGTETRPAGEIARQIQDQGGMINAYTSFDRTVYWIDVPASGAMGALDILADAMLNSTLPEDEYAKEQEVIRREFAMGFDDPNREGMKLMLRTVFGESPFRHPVIGYLDVYNKLTREDVMAYYKARYVPNNLTFVISGDVDARAVLDRLTELFAGSPRAAIEPVFVASEPEQLGRRDAHEEFAGTELTRLNLAWRIPGLDHPDTPALDVLGEILGSGRSSLLNQELRESRRIVHHVGAGMFSLQTDGVFVVQAVSDPDKREEAESAALEVINRTANGGISKDELNRAKRSLVAGQLSQLQTARGRASDLGGNWLLTKNLNFSRDYLDAIASVTSDDLTRVAKKYLREDRLNVTSLNPPGSLNEQTAEAGSSQIPGISMFTLPNGFRVIVREDPRLPLVSMVATFQGGVLAETPENNGITRLLASSLLKGTSTRSAREIAESIEGAGGSIGGDSGNNSWSVSADVMSPDLEMGMEILADVVQNPAFHEEEVALERETLLASIKAEDEQITSVARNLTRAKFFGDHPYALRSSGSPDQVAKLGPDDLRAFHNELAVAKNGVLAVFGDVKAEDVRALAEKYFGNMPEGSPAFDDLSQPSPPGEAVLASETLPKKQAVLMFAFPSPALGTEDFTVMELINSASNDLGSRFFDRIREQMGLAYFVGAAKLAGPVPGCQIFYLGTDPAKVPEVKAAFREEIARLAEEGLTDEELERAKKKTLGAEAIRNQSNEAHATTTALDELLGLGYDHSMGREERIRSVTREQTRETAKKYLSGPGYVQTVVGPES